MTLRRYTDAEAITWVYRHRGGTHQVTRIHHETLTYPDPSRGHRPRRQTVRLHQSLDRSNSEYPRHHRQQFSGSVGPDTRTRRCSEKEFVKRSGTGSFDEDAKLNALVRIAHALVTTSGEVLDVTLEAIREAGYSNSQIVEAMSAMGGIFLYNLINCVAAPALGFPKIDCGSFHQRETRPAAGFFYRPQT